MPTYDYVCDACDHAFELMQSIVAEPERKCPSCGKRKLRRLIGAGAGFVFKGSGFYQTDYRSEGYKKRAEADAKSNTDTKAGDSKAGDSKSDGAKSGSKSDSPAESPKPEKKAESASPKKKRGGGE